MERLNIIIFALVVLKKGEMTRLKYNSVNVVGYCVYFLINKKNIVYIGYTCSLGRRLAEHNQWSPLRKGMGYAMMLPNGKIMRDSANWHHYSYNWKYGLCKKHFTHYKYIPVKSRCEARDLESEKIKQYNPKYNNRRDYHWVMQKKKRIKQMPDYCLMRWEKKW